MSLSYLEMTEKDDLRLGCAWIDVVAVREGEDLAVVVVVVAVEVDKEA